MFSTGNKFYRYYFDDEPAEYGLTAGEYEEGKQAYVAVVDTTFTVSNARLQLSPPGALITDFGDSGITKFINDSSHAIYYLYRNRHHKYEWVDSQFGDEVPFAIDIGTDIFTTAAYIARIKVNGYFRYGPVPVMFGAIMYNGDTLGSNLKASPFYQVLTCKSCKKNEPKTVMPKPKIKLPQSDIGCSK